MYKYIFDYDDLAEIFYLYEKGLGKEEKIKEVVYNPENHEDFGLRIAFKEYQEDPINY